MICLSLRRTGAASLAVLALTAGAVASAVPALASEASPLPGGTRFYTPDPNPRAERQIADLRSAGSTADAELIEDLVHVPQAVWFTAGTPNLVQREVRQTTAKAAAEGTVPTLVIYNVPGRDCSQYSSGGAATDAAYRAWADGVAAGLSRGQRVVVVVEPDGLANLPSDCAGAYPGQDVQALTASRIADIAYAGRAVEAADPAALVYLDAGHSAWHSVGDIAQRLDAAGVRQFQGFSLDVSNYQPTPQLVKYGNWVSTCLYYANEAAHAGRYGDCASQYYPATPTDFSTWHLTDEWYDANVTNAPGAPTSARQLAHYVIDTSRNGQGPWTPAPPVSYPDKQDWCNPPGRGLGIRPTADTGYRLADAYLWIKTPGESDGQCNRGITGSTTDPVWGGIVDPAAGKWFWREALDLARHAVPPLP